MKPTQWIESARGRQESVVADMQRRQANETERESQLSQDSYLTTSAIHTQTLTAAVP